jgi:hypothetical protein
MMKAKQSSSRYEKFVERHGDDVFELEAVPPERLQEVLREAIDSVLDIEAFNAEVRREARRGSPGRLAALHETGDGQRHRR